MTPPIECICVNFDGSTEKARSNVCTFWVRGKRGARRFYRHIGYVGSLNPMQRTADGEMVGWPVYGEITVGEFGGWKEPTPEEWAAAGGDPAEFDPPRPIAVHDDPAEVEP